MPTPLEVLVKRVEHDSFFLGCALRNYADSEHLNDQSLARALGCDMATLNLLRLCRAPHTDRFKDDIDRIASRFNINRDALAQAARRGQVLLQMRRDAPSDQGLMLAARDLDDDQPRDQTESRP